MSIQPAFDPTCRGCESTKSIETIIDGKSKDLDGFGVRRVLPAAARRMVGPFIFFDHMGPAVFPPGKGMQVRPHPHINLVTVTYLFEGEMLHRDSLGSVQPIRPGAINWMTAGRGIVHSERMREEVIASGSRLHGIQLWLALPVAHEETEPSFVHHPAETIPERLLSGVRLRLLAGRAYGLISPVDALSSLFYVDASMPIGTQLSVPDEYLERAAYVVEGAVQCGVELATEGRMLVFSRGAQVTLEARADARVMLLGGAPLDGERHMFWNFVSSRSARIEKAKQDWNEGRFPKVPGDEIELIPLRK
ncbi:MAG: pirin family protein [Deltaproteobacteria bacterium]|nr:pirin family protein [Deltaproteobacteria bacterium]